MMQLLRYLIFISLNAFVLFPSFAQDLNYYFGHDSNFDSSVPKPSDVIYHEVGELHVTHDRLINYMKAVSNHSERMTYIQHGFSHERRPLGAVIVSSEKNMRDLDNLKERHRKFEKHAPVVIWQGYSIHGNEASGSNAALLYAYYLAANNDPTFLKMLDDVIIILYPSYNPDGMNRFASWVNTHKNKVLTPENSDMEYHEEWPRGRTNHYYFDLNRDWLPLTQPESVSKIQLFHEWMPNILTDHHEMGKDATFFFQPGIPDRTHPLTPKINQQLTDRIADFHREILDEAGSLYYSKESFDDFYYGKGSTFPDIQGCIGILFEQASSRGHLQNTENGVLSFPFTIKNQLLTSLSTLKAGYTLRNDLKTYQKDTYQSLPSGGVVVGVNADYSRLQRLATIFDQHGIEYHFQEGLSVNGRRVDYGLEVSYNQKKGMLAKAMFDSRTSFKDSVFYDVSAFNFGQAFNLEYEQKKVSVSSYNKMPTKTGSLVGSERSTYAYILPWEDYNSPNALYQILKSGLQVKVAQKPFQLEGRSYNEGTLMIPTQLQTAENIDEIMENIAKLSGQMIYRVSSGNSTGVNLGSRNFQHVRMPSIAIAMGDGVQSYDAGEVWHYLDVKQKITVSKLDMAHFSATQLNDFNVFILPDGRYNFTEQEKDYINLWVQNGGTIIALERATESMIGLGLSKSKVMKPTYKKDRNVRYSTVSEYRGGKVTGGAIIRGHIDHTNPLFYGYQSNEMPFFKRGNSAFSLAGEGYQNPLRYSKNVLLNGYLHSENASFLANKAGIQVTAIGNGRVVTSLENLNFRAFWLGTDKILANSVFFGNLISSQACLR